MSARPHRLAIHMAGALTVGVLAFQAVLLVPSPAQARTTWAQANCYGTGFAISTWKRSDAQSYAAQSDHEGYEWGGGCYKLNDFDDTPGAPDSGGEGADCSGFVFKTWALKLTYGTLGRKYWPQEKDIHGYYDTGSFYSPCATCPFKPLAKSYPATQYMDAFVYHDYSFGVGHIGMIYLKGSAGFDYIVEAKSDDLGTRIAYEDYRQQSAYQAVGRRGWTPDCYPQCVVAPATSSAVAAGSERRRA